MPQQKDSNTSQVGQRSTESVRSPNGDGATTGRSQSDSGGATEQAERKASQAANQAEQQAESVTDQAKQQVSSQLDSQKDRATDSLGSVAQALHQSSEQLREKDEGTAAHYVEQVAGQVDRVSDSLRNRSVGELVGEVESFARREPTLFLGGAFALGLLGSRFLTSSNQDSTSRNRSDLPARRQQRTAPTPTPQAKTTGRTPGTQETEQSIRRSQ